MRSVTVNHKQRVGRVLRTFEFGIVVEIFGLPRPELGTDWYRFEVCSLERGPLRAVGGVTLRSKNALPSLRHSTI